MRILLTLVLASAVLAGEDRSWISKLASKDAGPARARFLKRGTEALPALRAALKGEYEADVKAAVRAMIAEIEKREPRGLRFEGTAAVNGRDLVVDIKVMNRGPAQAILWPYLAVKLVDAAGNDVKPSSRRGRWGRRPRGCYLEKLKYPTLATGQAWTFRAKLSLYTRDPNLILGWKVPPAGKYTLAFTYYYDRQAAKKRCDANWPKLNDPQQPWNKALAFKHTFTVPLLVR